MSDFTKTMTFIKAETKRIQNENSEWQKEFNKAMSIRAKAKKHEKEENIDLAIKTYIENIAFCQSSSRINKINHFAHDIERVIILYGKTKQNKKLIEFLKINIENYNNFDMAEKWKKRLEKLNAKNTE